MIDNADLLKLASEVVHKARDIVNTNDVQDVIIVLCLSAVLIAKTHNIEDDSIRDLVNRILTGTTAVPENIQ